jgi:hypothetical protein
MNKKIIVSICIVLVAVLMFFFLVKKTNNKPTVPTPISTSTSTTPVVSAPDCLGTCINFDPDEYFKGEEKGFTSYVDSVAKNTVTFKELPGRTVNMTFDVYVNGVLAGQAGGEGMSQASFSPDHKYFGFRTRSNMGCAGKCQDTAIYVVDLDKPTVLSLNINFGEDYKNNPNILKNGESILESYIWGPKDTILVTGFPIGIGKSGKNYRISPKQVWSFDPNKLQVGTTNGVIVKTAYMVGVFVKNLPEQ